VSRMTRTVAAATILAIAAAAAILPAAAGPAGALVAAAPVPQGYRPLTIKTLPPIAGVRVKVDGSELVTGPNGTVRTLITKQQRDALVANRDAHLQVITTNVGITPALRGRFHGWYQEGYVFTPQNPVGEVEIATFDLDALTGFTFVDRHHAALDARGITDMQIRSSLGGLTDIGRPKAVWLRAAVVTSVAGKVVLKDVEWRLASVTFHQTNIVQRGAQHFKPRHAPKVAVQVNVFTVQFHALDAFFGSPKGTMLKLTLPDGTIRTVALHKGRATVEQLPSGDYDVLIDARGLGKDQSITVTNDASIDLKVLSFTDIALVLVVLALLVGGVLLFGLRVRRRRRRLGELGTAPDPVPRPGGVLVGPEDR
jgi:hypothetical protein